MVIKTLKVTKNPLSDYGNIITGDRFVGRRSEIADIQNRVLQENYGNISIVGLPRIGKSSLVWKAIIEEKDKSANNNIIIRLNIGEISDSKDFFISLVNEVHYEIKEISNEVLSLQLENILCSLKQENISSHEIRRNINRFFKKVKKNNFRLIFVLDEFDSIQRFFRLEDFQFLREISINPDTRVALVTISRHTIQEIELENGFISTLAGIFSVLNLSTFNKEDFSEYWGMLERNGIETDNEFRNSIYYFTGSHPFLMDLFNYEIINHLLINPLINVTNLLSSSSSNLKLSLMNNFDNIITILKEEKILNKAFQILIGPVYNLDQKSIEKLIKFGFIIKSDDLNRFICFSTFFQEYLFVKQKEFDIWPLWNETEREVRELIKHFLYITYGDKWEIEFLKKYKNMKISLDNLQKQKQRNIKSFGDRASESLIDYTYPLDMFDIFISTDWHIYKDVFIGQKKDWKEKFFILSKVRNPIAHSNSNFITEDDHNLAVGICNLILENIKLFLKNR